MRLISRVIKHFDRNDLLWVADIETARSGKEGAENLGRALAIATPGLRIISAQRTAILGVVGNYCPIRLLQHCPSYVR